jgi:hypothetical protein
MSSGILANAIERGAVPDHRNTAPSLAKMLSIPLTAVHSLLRDKPHTFSRKGWRFPFWEQGLRPAVPFPSAAIPVAAIKVLGRCRRSHVKMRVSHEGTSLLQRSIGCYIMLNLRCSLACRCDFYRQVSRISVPKVGLTHSHRRLGDHSGSTASPCRRRSRGRRY